MSVILTFDAERHAYTLDGEDVPSVTQVLEATGLLDLSHIPRDTRLRALERGRRVHAAVHYLIEGTLDERSVDDEDRGYLEAARAFLADSSLIPLVFEHRVSHPRYRYAGTIDLVGVWDGAYAVVDWKSSLNPTSLCCDIQTAAYAEALRQAVPPELVDYRAGEPLTRVGMSLRKDGTYRVSRYTDPRDFTLFLAALTVTHEQRRRRFPVHALRQETLTPGRDEAEGGMSEPREAGMWPTGG